MIVYVIKPKYGDMMVYSNLNNAKERMLRIKEEGMLHRGWEDSEGRYKEILSDSSNHDIFATLTQCKIYDLPDTGKSTETGR